MRTVLRNAILATGVLLAGAGGTAWAADTAIIDANVPFAFVVNGQTFQPGRYTIEQDDQSPSVLLIRADRGSHAARFVTTNRDVSRDPAGTRAALTFKRYEGLYRLEGVWKGDRDGFQIVQQ